MKECGFIVNQSALLAYSVISCAERDALQAALDPLIGQPEKQWWKAGATRLESAEPLYLIRVDESLRAIVRPTAGGQPEVLDLVRHETLERFFQQVG